MTTLQIQAEPTARGHLPGTRAYRRVVIALFLAGVATFSLIYSTQALLPELATSFHVGASSSALTMSLTTLGLGMALLVAGPISDVVGRTRLIHASLLASTVVGLACAAAPTWPSLLLLRFLSGVALAGLPAVATAYLREELDPSTHARVTGLYIGGTAIGGMTGRLVTGAVADVAGWRSALLAAGVVGLACTLAVRLLLPASQHFVPQGPQVRAILERTRRSMADPALLALYGVGGCAAGVQLAIMNTIGFRLEAAPFHFGVGVASLIFLVYPIGSLSSATFGRLADRYGRRAVLPIGCLLAVAGALLSLPTALGTMIAGIALLVAGFFGIHGVASGWIPARAHAGGVPTAQAASLYLFAYYLGASVFGDSGSWTWSHYQWHGVVVLAVGLLTVTTVLAVLLRRTPALGAGR